MVHLTSVILIFGSLCIIGAQAHNCYSCEGSLEECRNPSDEFCHALSYCYVTHHANGSVSMGCKHYLECPSEEISEQCKYGQENCTWCCEVEHCNYPPEVVGPTTMSSPSSSPMTPTTPTTDDVTATSPTSPPTASGAIQPSTTRPGPLLTTGSSGLQCYNGSSTVTECKDNMVLEECSTQHEPNPICSIQVSNGQVSMGCKSKNECQHLESIHGKCEEELTNMTVCSYCCDTMDGCNNEICLLRDTTTPFRPTSQPGNTTLTPLVTASSPSGSSTMSPPTYTTRTPPDNITTSTPGNTTMSPPDNTTTSTPGNTTISPPDNTTTSTPGNTTMSPLDNTTTSAPGNTTMSPPDNTTTSTPGNTTMSPPDNTTTSTPGNTTMSPPDNTTTSAPGNTTMSPPDNTTTSTPGNTTMSPPDNTTTSAPGNTTMSPPDNTTTSTPGNTTMSPPDNTTSSAPGNTTMGPPDNNTTSTPGNTTMSPPGTTSGPTGTMPSPTNSTLLSTTVSDRLFCYECSGSIENCRDDLILVECPKTLGNDVVCFAHVSLGDVEMGCQMREECNSTASMVPKPCVPGDVDDQEEACSYCCNDKPGCNNVLKPKETTQVSSTTKQTTQVQSSTTISPDNITMSLPGTTSSQPGNTTMSPPDNTTTSTPGNTTMSPPDNTTTSTPGNTTMSPPDNTTTSTPGNTTMSPPDNTTTSTPGNTTMSPPDNTTTSTPGNTTMSPPDTTTSTPGNTTMSPPDNTITSTPGNTTMSPPDNTTTSTPGNTTMSPPDNTTTSAPGNTTMSPPDNTTTSTSGNTTMSPPDNTTTSTPDHTTMSPPDNTTTSTPGNTTMSPPDNTTTSTPGKTTMSPPDNTTTSTPGNTTMSPPDNTTTSTPGNTTMSPPGATSGPTGTKPSPTNSTLLSTTMSDRLFCYECSGSIENCRDDLILLECPHTFENDVVCFAHVSFGDIEMGCQMREECNSTASMVPKSCVPGDVDDQEEECSYCCNDKPGCNNVLKPKETTQVSSTTKQTTQLQSTTTIPPDNTTMSVPGTTSSQPGNTTMSPPITTSSLAGNTTMSPPITTSSQPGNTTMSPPITTSSLAGNTTMSPPITTNSQPGNTTMSPPITTSSQPGNTTMSPPMTTSSQPGNTTMSPPITTSSQPDNTTMSPPITTSSLAGNTTMSPPITTSSQPGNTTMSPPITTSSQPGNTTMSPPITTSSQPGNTTMSPPITTSSQPPITSSQAINTTMSPPGTAGTIPSQKSTTLLSTTESDRLSCYECSGTIDNCRDDLALIECQQTLGNNVVCFAHVSFGDIEMGCQARQECNSTAAIVPKTCVPGDVDDNEECSYCCSDTPGCNNIFEPKETTDKYSTTSRIPTVSSHTNLITDDSGPEITGPGDIQTSEQHDITTTEKLDITGTGEQTGPVTAEPSGSVTTPDDFTTPKTSSRSSPTSSLQSDLPTTEPGDPGSASGPSTPNWHFTTEVAYTPRQETSSERPAYTSSAGTESWTTGSARSSSALSSLTTSTPYTTKSSLTSSLLTSTFTTPFPPVSTTVTKMSSVLSWTSATSFTPSVTSWHNATVPPDFTSTIVPATMECMSCKGSVDECISTNATVECLNNYICMTRIRPGDDPEVEMGCEIQELCENMIGSSALCEQGKYSEPCAYCCDEYDYCNRDILLPTAPPTTVAPDGQCAIVNHTYCMDQWKESIDNSAIDPTMYFAQFCRGMPDLVRCLMGSTEDCCVEDIEYLRPQYDEILTNMSAMCPESCSREKADECIVEYYEEVLTVITGGGDCDMVLKISEAKEYCLRMSLATCSMDIKEFYNLTYWSIRLSAEENCDGLTEWTTTNSTIGCNPDAAKDCITVLGNSIIDVLLNGTTDLKDVCDDFDKTEECYGEKVDTCHDDVKAGFEAGFNFTTDLVQEDCDDLYRPVCNTDAAMECILDLWTLVIGAEDFQTVCDSINATQVCVDSNSVGCSEHEQDMLQDSLDYILNEVINGRCEDIITCPVDKDITLIEGGPTYNLEFQILQPPSVICQGSENCQVYIDVDIELGDSPRCRDGKHISQAVIGQWANTNDVNCSYQVTETNWNQLQSVPVSAKLDFKIDGDQKRTLTIWIRIVIDGKEEQRSLCDILVTIKDMDFQSQCRSVNDPHTTSFDNFYFNNFVEGHFILYKHKTLPYQVQIIGQRCNDKATCNCGVSVQSGDMVLFIDRCRKKKSGNKCKNNGNQQSKYDCQNMMEVHISNPSGITPGTTIMRKSNGKKWEVILPHGTFIKIATNGDFLNVWVTPSPVDWQNTEGLCGFFNGNDADDLTMRDGTIYTDKGSGYGEQPNAFLKDWRCEGNERIYKGVAANPYTPSPYCDCRTNDTGGNVCGPFGLTELCDFDIGGVIDSTTVQAIGRSGGGRRRRQNRQLTSRRLLQTDPEDDLDLDEDWEAPEIVDGIYNISTAKAKCEELFQEVDILTKCNAIDVPKMNDLESCIDDLRVTGNIEWIDSQIESLKDICMTTIQREPRYSEDPDAIALAAGIESINCPNECSQNGECIAGKCECSVAFTGDDCSFNMSAALGDTFIPNNGLCDTGEQRCEIATVVGFGFIPGQTKCFVQKVEVDETGVTLLDPEMTEVPSALITLNMVYCTLTEESPHYIKLSNDGSSFSNQSLYIPKDQVCWNCDAIDDPRCIRNPDSCVTENGCYADMEESLDDSCYVCDPSKASDALTYVCSSLPLVAIVVPVVVVVVGVLLAIVIYVMVKKNRKSKSFDNESMTRGSWQVDTSPQYEPALEDSGIENSGQDPSQVHPIDGLHIEEEGLASVEVDNENRPALLFSPVHTEQGEDDLASTGKGEMETGEYADDKESMDDDNSQRSSNSSKL